jgi:hypothetical protein
VDFPKIEGNRLGRGYLISPGLAKGEDPARTEEFLPLHGRPLHHPNLRSGRELVAAATKRGTIFIGIFIVKEISMFRCIPLLFLLFLSTTGRSRGLDTCRYMDTNLWLVKGKILPWFFLSESGINYTLGTEYGNGKKHSIGFDLVYNDGSSGHEVYDSATNGYVSGPRRYHVSRAVFLNYKRYFHSPGARVDRWIEKVFGQSEHIPYIGSFVRYAKVDYHFQPNYETNTVSYDEWQYSAGIVAGVLVSVFDINIGPFYKQKFISEVIADGGNELHSSVKNSFGLRIGVNVCGVLARRSHYHRLGVDPG